MPSPDLSDLTVAQVHGWLKSLPSVDDALLARLEADPRRGVQRLASSVRRQRKAEGAEQARLERMHALERRLHRRGIHRIAGVDEAGRGPLAGPVVAAAVVFPPDADIPGVNDSKVLSPERREELYHRIRETAEDVSVAQADAAEIDRLNILEATYLAMRRALDGLMVAPDRVLVDGKGVPGGPYPELALVDGDATSFSIAAASIVAKVTRDRQMVEMDAKFPGYGFARHKGYGSPDHLKAIAELGPCAIHRRSFRSVSPHRADRSEDFRLFVEGIDQARDLEQLKSIGRSIAGARDVLPPDEVEELRARYARRRGSIGGIGPRGEELAAKELLRKGYRILKRRYRRAGGEIDIVAVKGNVRAFVEVKAASSTRFGAPETWVTPQKQRQIARVARAYTQHHPHRGLNPRFDVMVIRISSAGHRIRHIEGAFRVPEG
jgi:ribonuclease HII